MEPLVCVSTPISAITSAKAELWEKAQPRSLLRQSDFAHQFGITRVGAQGINLWLRFLQKDDVGVAVAAQDAKILPIRRPVK
jgi:hypothetical protein